MKHRVTRTFWNSCPFSSLPGCTDVFGFLVSTGSRAKRGSSMQINRRRRMNKPSCYLSIYLTIVERSVDSLPLGIPSGRNQKKSIAVLFAFIP